MKQGTLSKFSLGVLAVFCFCICLPLHTVKASSLLEEKILTELRLPIPKMGFAP